MLKFGKMQFKKKKNYFCINTLSIKLTIDIRWRCSMLGIY